MTIADFTQALDISVDRGDIELRPGNGPIGKIDVRTHSGDIDLSLPEKPKVQLKATTERGEVTNDYNPALAAHGEGNGATLAGSTGEGPRITLETGRGVGDDPEGGCDGTGSAEGAGAPEPAEFAEAGRAVIGQNGCLIRRMRNPLFKPGFRSVTPACVSRFP